MVSEVRAALAFSRLGYLRGYHDAFPWNGSGGGGLVMGATCKTLKFYVCLLALLLSWTRGVSAANEGRKNNAVPVVHVFVALVDRQHQGIIATNAALENGQSPTTNQYWGARFGLYTFLRQSAGWTCLSSPGGDFPVPSKRVLVRAVFRQAETGMLLVADAYDGRFIREAIRDFLQPPVALPICIRKADRGVYTLRHLERANLRVYVGHNGLMDFSLPLANGTAKNSAPIRAADAMVIACKSRQFFKRYLNAAKLNPVLLTTGLLAPEGYTVEAAVRAWARRKSPTQIRLATAASYAQYQHLSFRGAEKLFSTATKTTQLFSPQKKSDSPGSVRQTKPLAKPHTIDDLACPDGYQRLPYPSGGFAAYVRALRLKPPGAGVVDYRGRTVKTAAEVGGVIAWARPPSVQQCADVAIRLYAEYQYYNRQRGAIAFASLSGDWIHYAKWLRGTYSLNRRGTRIVYRAGEIRRADKVAEFNRYLRFVMLYANSSSLARDLRKVNVKAISPGDCYVQPDPSGRGGIGHVSVVLDVCRNMAGKRLFLFGYGYIPAQDFHLPLPTREQGIKKWFTLEGFRAQVSAFGAGLFYSFEPPR